MNRSSRRASGARPIYETRTFVDGETHGIPTVFFWLGCHWTTCPFEAPHVPCSRRVRFFLGSTAIWTDETTSWERMRQCCSCKSSAAAGAWCVSTRRYSRPPLLPLPQVLSVFRGFHTGGVCQVCFSPDGKVKFSCVMDRVVLIGT